MRQQSRPRGLCAIAGVALCLVALLVQGTVLPLAHALHEAGRGGDGAAAWRARGASAADTVRPRSTRSAHDATACPLCATLAHARTGIVTVTLRAPGPQVALTAPCLAAALWSDVASPTGGGPRAPPSLSA